jgi:flagellar protein FliO/FliZ
MDELVLGARVLLALACVVGLIWVVARRAGWGSGARRPAGPEVRVVGRQALGRHAGVAVGERRLLLGFGEQQVTMLTELDPEAEPAAVVETVPATVLAAEPAPAPAPVTDEPVDLTDIERATAAVRASSAASASAAQAHGALNGSILAPSTWKQALSALQERTVRR